MQTQTRYMHIICSNQRSVKDEVVGRKDEVAASAEQFQNAYINLLRSWHMYVRI